MSEPIEVRPTHRAVIEAAVEATGARGGWLLRLVDDALVVVATAGDASPSPVGSTRQIEGVVGHAVTSGQAAAVRLDPDATPGSPSAVLAVPCEADDIVGVLELVDAEGGFTYDHLELTGVLAMVAGAALSEDRPPQLDTPQ
ncbi:MAG: GAF domain-containing protein [Acidimicrobiales bacterium]|nr:GAF domain-containing protein [Acidimicrobiales bacterium]